jgi:hypothetical protein
MNTKRVLLTDIIFPNKLATWRLVITKSFIDNYDCDIVVVNRISHYASIYYNFDYNELMHTHSLGDYDILIFNGAFNYVNVYNEIGFDGTKFNGLGKADYVFRKKKYRNIPFDVNKYDAVFHIFLMCYETFNANFTYEYSKQTLYLLPGGGLEKLENINKINSETKIVSGQSFITEYIEKFLPRLNKYINCYGNAFFYKDQKFNVKKMNSSDCIKVCFTSLGPIEEKGANHYIKIVELYKKKFDDNVIFYSISNVPNSEYIKHLNIMAQTELNEFYFNEIDIYMNLDTKKALNGFPLGAESMSCGCVLFTPDPDNLNVKNNYYYGNELVVIDINNYDDITNKIHQLYVDRELLWDYSKRIQEKTYTLFGYNNIMKKIFNFIDN